MLRRNPTSICNCGSMCLCVRLLGETLSKSTGNNAQQHTTKNPAALIDMKFDITHTYQEARAPLIFISRCPLICALSKAHPGPLFRCVPKYAKPTGPTMAITPQWLHSIAFAPGIYNRFRLMIYDITAKSVILCTKFSNGIMRRFWGYISFHQMIISHRTPIFKLHIV